jgi:hypothetical protein
LRPLVHAGCGELYGGARLHRHVAHAGVGAALRSHLEVEPPFALHRKTDSHVLAVDLRLAEELVLVGEAARELRCAQAHHRVAVGGELEALAIQVIAVGDGEGHFDARGVEGARREAERLLGFEKVVGAPAELELRRRGSGERQAKQECKETVQVLVSAATQSR